MMDKRKLIIVLLVAMGIVATTVYFVKNKQNTDRTSDRLQVVASFYPLYFFAQQIGGEHVRVVNITPAGGEPHDYEPSPQDIMEIEKSRLLILNGGGLETWGEKIMRIVDPAKTQIVIAAEGLSDRTLVEGESMVADPHVWLAPSLAEKMVERIKVGLAQVDPQYTALYETRAQDLITKLHDLDSMYKDGLTGCSNNNIVTAHAAFGYLTASYHLNQVSIAGLSPDAEPSPRQLGEVVRVAKEKGVKFIFFESLTSPKLSETIAREVGARTLVLNPLEGLTPDEMKQGKDYFSIMKQNLKNLALACR